MKRKNESGKSGMMMGMLFIGVLIVVGVIFLVKGLNDDQTLDTDLKNQVEPQDREIVNTINDTPPEPSAVVAEEEEEEMPSVLRTVDGTGRTMYIGTEKVDIILPGKGTMKATKFATATNKKMKAGSKPARAKPDHVITHPSKRKKNNPGRGNKGNEPPKGGGEDDSGSAGSGGQMGGGGGK